MNTRAVWSVLLGTVLVTGVVFAAVVGGLGTTRATSTHAVATGWRIVR